MQLFTQVKIKSLASSISCLAATVCSLLALITCSLPASALPADFYSTSSRLANGKWMRVNASATGIHFISNAALKSMGFSDPSKVMVYGYGGRLLSELLNDSNHDDLPPAPALRTDAGIFFFATDNVSWKYNISGAMSYSHTSNYFGNTSYYFLSDHDAELPRMEARNCSEILDDLPLVSFRQRLLYDNDQQHPANTGRIILGEDFRSAPSRNIKFNLTDNSGSEVYLRSTVGTKITNGTSALRISANGSQLSEPMNIPAFSGKYTYLTYTKAVDHFYSADQTADIGLQFSTNGAVTTARLDYLEMEYSRWLRLKDNQLHFYGYMHVPTTFSIEGCSKSTIIWEVTDPSAPRAIQFTLNGNKALFTEREQGYHEYVAFNPSDIKLTVDNPEPVANQDLHSRPIPDMLIISPAPYLTAAEKIADLHRRADGMDVCVLTPQTIYNEFSSGNADVTAFRRLLKMWYDRGLANPDGRYTRYCLLLSRPTYNHKKVGTNFHDYEVVPTFYPLEKSENPNSMVEQLSDNYSFPIDDYIGMLDDTPSSFDVNRAKIHTAVGRMPVKSVAEANAAADKLVKYVESPELGAWRNSVMLIADDQDNNTHLTQSQDVYKRLRSQGNGADFLYERLYLDSYPMSYTGSGTGYPEAKARMMKVLDDGVVWLGYIGHANPRELTHEDLFNWKDMNSMTNRRLPFMHAATCEFLRWDDETVSGAEVMWLYPDAGVIGMICPNRTVYMGPNGTLNNYTSPYVFRRDADGEAARVGDIHIGGKNDMGYSDNKMKFSLMADPAMRLASPRYHVAVETIDGIEIDGLDAADFPVAPARGRVPVAGYIAGDDGEVLTDFNGLLSISLYDAEKVITTYGNGENGVSTSYNDRKTHLYSGRVQVTDGRWSTTLLMPSEIDHNFSPALISMYAFSQEGLEANGACESLYVYGFDYDAPEDTEGPEITDCYINNPASGTVVHSTPVFYATISDESGINLSDSGIGHQMAITLDGSRYLSDVAYAYSPDTTDPCRGSVVYPLPELEPGQHQLTLTVWDNANNSSTATLDFQVGVGLKPGIFSLTSSASPAVTSTVFTVTTDRPLSVFEYQMEVYDLNGRLVWSKLRTATTDIDSTLSETWDLTDNAGRRVARGIYIARATLVTQEGTKASASTRLAVAAPY